MKRRKIKPSSEMTSMLFLDPPQHTRVRSIFNKAFTPRRLESLRPRIQKLTDDLLDKVQPRGEMDLIADFAAPLPITVIADLLGFPSQDYAQIKRWSDDDIAVFEKVWLEVIQEESAKDPLFKKISDDYLDFRKKYKVWGDAQALKATYQKH